MTSYPNNGSRTLSDAHRRMVYDESAITPDVAAARGYRTIKKRSEIPEEFPPWQRRLGLLIPTYSPDGETSGYQLRPNRPIPRKSGSGPKYETPHGSRITLDVNPLMLEEVRSGGDLWLTEGCKKVDALTSKGLPTVGIIGVWNFAEPRSKSRIPLRCWDHVQLEGRRVYVVYDADARTNADVQEALRRLVIMLEGLGASVLAVYLPAVKGDGKAGVDDYLAAGGTVAQLRLMAAPYKPVDVGAERMSRDETLRAVVEDLERNWKTAEWKGIGGHSAKDVYLKLIETAKKRGKIHPDGIRFEKAQGPLALEAKVSTRTLWKTLNRLEDMGLIYRDNEGRRAEKSGAFVLRANVRHKGRTTSREGGAGPGKRGYGHGDLHLRAPRLRWSRPKYTPRRGFVRGTRKVRQAPKLEPRDRIERLGKIRGAILDALDLAGGTLTLQEIADALHRSRPRDIRRRNLPMLEDAGILTVDGDAVTLAHDWLEALEDQRRLGKEIEAEEIARERYKLKSRAYHNRDKARASKPSAASLEAIKRSHEQRRAGLAAERERAKAAARAEERRKAEAFVRDRLRELGRIRLALLQDIWRDEGGDAWTIPAAVEAMGYRVEELPEYGNRRFVFPPMEGAA
jgi:Domain of unknown function (DUF3854)